MRLTLNHDTLPKDWEDEERINHLFGPFRPQHINPIAYTAKMTFWKTMIKDTCLHCGYCSFDLSDLENAFIRNKRKPLCFKDVIDDMLRNKEIMYLNDFKAQKPTVETWTSWAVNSFVKNPARWSFYKLKESLLTPTATQYDQQFIHLLVTKEKGELLLSNLSDDLKGSMIPLETLLENSKSFIHDGSELEIVVHWLELQGLATTSLIDNKKLVKFPQSGQTLEMITDIDRAIFSLEENEKLLLKDVEQLETQKEDIIEEARSYVRKKMPQMAKNCLRKKKEIEKQIQNKVLALNNIQVLLSRVKDTETNSKVFESYKLSLSTLKSQLTKAGLTEDNVSSTMLQVQEVLDVQDEIQTMLGEPASPSLSTPDEDFEAELAQLLKDKPIDQELDLESELDLPEPSTISPGKDSIASEKRKPQQLLG